MRFGKEGCVLEWTFVCVRIIYIDMIFLSFR